MEYMKYRALLSPEPDLTPRLFVELIGTLSLFAMALAAALRFLA